MPVDHPQTFCIWPWSGLEINADGTARPCCNWNGRLTDQSGKEYRVQEVSLDTIRHSQSLQSLRKDLVSGKKNPGCDQCWSKESVPGKSSLRTDTNRNFQHYIQQHEFTEHAADFLSLGVSLGNICNLRCRVCGPWASSVWVTDELRIKPKTSWSGSLEHRMLTQGQWPRTADTFWESFKSAAQELEEVRFYGGEPMLVPQQRQALAFLVEQNLSAKLKLVYNTNCTIFPEEFVDNWTKFRAVDICLSLDNLRKKFEYERNPADWTSVCGVIDRYQDLQSQQANISLKCVITVSVFNIMDLPELVRWIEKKKFRGGIFWNILHSMEEFCIAKLPQQHKDHIKQCLLHKRKHIRTRQDREIDLMIDFMYSQSGTPQDHERLLAEIQRVDQIRQQKLAHSHPELASLLGLA